MPVELSDLKPGTVVLINVGHSDKDPHFGVVLGVEEGFGATLAVSTSTRDDEQFRSGLEARVNWMSKKARSGLTGWPKGDRRPSYFYGFRVEDPLRDLRKIQSISGTLHEVIREQIVAMWQRYKEAYRDAGDSEGASQSQP